MVLRSPVMSRICQVMDSVYSSIQCWVLPLGERPGALWLVALYRGRASHSMARVERVGAAVSALGSSGSS
ncbi:Uncharacterised protein [Mycobacteroides abscessus subsp. massiliense]|nr:Uncharacterised protein [Mycobacteroides abscessus subsp. massiliense]